MAPICFSNLFQKERAKFLHALFWFFPASDCCKISSAFFIFLPSHKRFLRDMHRIRRFPLL